MARRLQWPQDGARWPGAAHARLLDAGGVRWFVRRQGRGPVVLLLHGTGASSHSWRDLVPRLQSRFDLVAVDLPGHGFSSLPSPSGMTLPGVTAALGALLRQLDAEPALLVGHSAGVAVALRLCLEGLVAPAAVLGFNAALLPWAGAAGQLFAPLARLLAAAPGVPELLAWRAANPAALQRLIDNTGSRLDAEGIACYARLVRNPGHVEGALAMMAHWDLQALWHDLPRLRVPLTLVVAGGDRTVPPAQADEVVRRWPPGGPVRRVDWPGLGHLAHEERPDRAAEAVLEAARPGLA